MDDSIRYGLRNPAFTDDIAKAMIERAYPTTIDELSSNPAIDVSDIKFNNGQPQKDSYNPTQSQKDKANLKKILAGAGIVTLCVLAAIFGKKAFNFTKNKIPDNMKNIGSNIKNGFNYLKDKTKDGFQWMKGVFNKFKK